MILSRHSAGKREMVRHALDDDRSAPDSPEEAASNKLSLAADDPDSLMLYVVAHDNRGGTDWRTLSLSR
jgi:hypothetical protein